MRSKLFVPASRPELFSKALASAADAISFDLEDAVQEDRKAEARARLAQHLKELGTADQPKVIIVRTNAADSAHFHADLDAIVGQALNIVNLPKVENADTVLRAVQLLEKIETERGLSRPIEILANIESPSGLHHAAEIATAHCRVTGLQIGYGDLFSPLGIASAEPFATQYVRVRVRMAAGMAGIDAYDGAYPDIANPDGYRLDAQAAHRLGFAGKSCIHPSQIALANEVFVPARADIEHALRVIEAARDAHAKGIGAFVVDGRLIDGPFITRAERVIAIARKLGLAD
jgi:citrate lyase subunit beta/citryl-CoA lyase